MKQISLAPIHEYTNSCFRILCEEYGADFTYVPLVNVTSVIKGKIPFISNEEKNVIVQLSGSDPKEFAKAIEIIENTYPKIKGFNINAGCPSYVTMKIGAGSALMSDLDNLLEIIKKCKESTSLPVSVKSRIFSDEKRTIDFYKEMENFSDYVIVHGRTVKQGYSGKANWEMIKKIKQNLSIPVIGNGDVQNRKEAEKRIKDGYCDGVMIGRAALRNPKIFQKISNEEFDRFATIKKYFEKCEKIEEEMKNLGLDKEIKYETSLNAIKLIMTQMTKGEKNATQIRNEIMKCKSKEEIIEKINIK